MLLRWGCFRGRHSHDRYVIEHLVELDDKIVNKVATDKERYGVSLPKWLVAQIDAIGDSRSAFLADSVTKALQERIRKIAG